MLLFFKLLKGELFCCKVSKINFIAKGDPSLASLAMATPPPLAQHPAHAYDPISRSSSPFHLIRNFL